MVSVLDVAANILAKRGSMSAMKLQKLVYYCQAWSLVWDDRPMFHEPIEAWAMGPVVPRLYREHKGMFEVSYDDIKAQGDANALDDCANETVDAVLGYYADKPTFWLSDLTHRERPWKHAREGLATGERGSEEITHASMAEYYGSLFDD